MNDPLLSLAFSVHANKGVFALLIGSGVSRTAGIPTGWEVVLDLIQKLAHLKHENCDPDPVIWYKNTFGKEPDYAVLLDSIAKSPSERSQLLRGYFEPSEEERSQNIKVPTVAHKAIAELTARGYIRVIVTTNFDRLLEKALEAVGVNPTVISTPDAAEGALPLPHTKCTIIKVNGDYLDSRIKNTPEELGRYDKRIDRLLDRIFDEFGLIVCGWSAEWDTALRAAIERCRSHRFTTFWACRTEPDGLTKKLIDLRRAEILRIKDADSFFQEVKEKVFALEELERPHPQSTKIAVSTLKRYIVDDTNRIRLHDLVMHETEKLYGELSEKDFPTQGVPFSVEELKSRVQRYEALTEIPLALMVNGCYWGGEAHVGLWVKCLERIANLPKRDGLVVWLNLKLYPALLLLYGGGIASIAAENYGAFSALLTKTKVRDIGEEQPAALALYTWAVMENKVPNQLPGMERHKTPLSDHLYDILHAHFIEILPDDTHYSKCFDRFEYLHGLVHVDLREKQSGRLWGPVGRFAWNYRDYGTGGIMKKIELEAKEADEKWAPLQAGLFDGSVVRSQQVKTAFDQLLKSTNWWL